jgi:hypothetical protein
MGKLTHGQVEVDLDDETLTLQPTLRAYERIEKKYGGLTQALTPLSSFNLESVVFIISVGANITGKEKLADLKESVFQRGISTVAARAVEYVTLLMNPTGRSDDEDTPEGN